jgi:hypothetical protein
MVDDADGMVVLTIRFWHTALDLAWSLASAIAAGECGRWTVDGGRWAVGSGQWAVGKCAVDPSRLCCPGSRRSQVQQAAPGFHKRNIVGL